MPNTAEEYVLNYGICLQALIDLTEFYHNFLMVFVFVFLEWTEAVIRKLQHYLNILVNIML